MENIINLLGSLSGAGLSLLMIILLLMLNKWFFGRLKTVKESVNAAKNAVSYFIIFIGALSFILLLPIDKNLKGQILSFLAIIISAAIALSSTTILGNIIAGVMNNTANRFRNGDLIGIGNLMGRVTRKSIFFVEIQLEDSNFVTIPNLFIASNPVKRTRKSNTVISSVVSLGYDVPKSKVEKYLKSAAVSAGLENPYVYIMELGDFSITYKIHGFLENSDNFFSAQSLLKGHMVNSLHKNNIEIVSPAFIYQRKADETVFIPKEPADTELNHEQKNPEELIFDKAIKSEKIEDKKDYIANIDKKIENLKQDMSGLLDKVKVKQTEDSINRLKSAKEKIIANIEEQSEKLNEKTD